MERVFKDAFDKKQALKKIPTLRKRGDRDRFSLPQGFKIEGRRYILTTNWLD
jgi:putative transposase